MKRLIIASAFFALAQAGNIDWSKIETLQTKVQPPSGYNKQYVQHLYKNRIIGGVEVETNSIRYQVALFIDSDDGKTYFCGASLISPKYVLTAAHCAIVGIQITLILGVHNIREEEITQIRLNSTKFIIHEDYDNILKINDIALIELPEAVPETPEITLVKLPRFSDATNDYVGVIATISGWGKTGDNEAAISNVLYSVQSDIIGRNDCDDYFPGYIQESHVCVNGDSACSGDSGGPLVYEDKQIGIVSFGSIFGCEINWPSVFTRTTSYLQWIQDNSDVIIEQ